MQACLCLNVGSSSLKAAAYPPGRQSRTPAFRASHDASVEDCLNVDGIDEAMPVEGDDYGRTALRLLEIAKTRLNAPVAVVHRVVHGGNISGAPVEITPEIVARLEEVTPLAPLHQPANLAPVTAISAERPDVRQLACFDTSFHETIPEVARRLPLPESAGGGRLRRYGFHGLSHASAARRLAAEGLRRMVVLHLGGGSSVTAIDEGESIDTTMSATPLAGPMMTTRSGSIDPGALIWLLRDGHDLDQLERMLWSDSGLKGVSGISNDLRDLIGHGSPDAALAVDMYCADLVRHVGAMAARLGGMDGLVFTGGAGAGQPLIRERVAEAFRWSGVVVDPQANRIIDEQSVSDTGSRISASESAVPIWVLPVDEETQMAIETEHAREESP
ncbi:MAG: acetate kinase [Rhodobacteraceae bacterium]|jgi:acetate kinase|nr:MULTISPECIES: hypothetical protein [Salipiger]MAB06879.1 acetate kinase [Paracoccaceae bacterium]GFZ94569.1 hypothetical protein GCM10011326_01680 [Salipiger profundus]SFB91488.1 acetate kinase [Salipiger profundus]